MDVMCKDKEFNKMMKQANPQVKHYLNSVLKDIEDDNDRNAVKLLFSEQFKQNLSKKPILEKLSRQNSNSKEKKPEGKKTLRSIVIDKISKDQNLIVGADGHSLACKIEKRKNKDLKFMSSQMLMQKTLMNMIPNSNEGYESNLG